MQSFAHQCLDMARAILGHNLDAIQADGSLLPIEGELPLPDEPGHAALALGEFYRATQETNLGGYDLIDLCAKAISAQAANEEEGDNAMAYAALALLAFGPSQERNPVWEKLSPDIRTTLGTRLMPRQETDFGYRHEQAFDIAKAVARFSMGLSKKDDTSNLVDRFIEGIKKESSNGFCDDKPDGIGGVFDIYGVLSFIFIRQALQLHSNMQLKERKLPSLRTFGEKYIKLMPDLVRSDGLGWAYGSGVGAYGQMHCITILLQGLRDGWISEEQKALYCDVIRRLFHFFFVTYLDQEHGFLVIRDAERTAGERHSTRLASFDAARYLCQWARLAMAIGGKMDSQAPKSKTGGRFILFDKSNRKEQGLFLYQDAASGLQFQLPLLGAGGSMSSDSLAFPHAPGIFDWPVGKYLPILQPELRFGEHTIIPSFYGQRCTTGLGLRNSLSFRYEQPELISKEGKIISGLGTCKVNWTFQGDKVTSEFVFTVKNQIQLDSFRYVMALAAPHSHYHIGTSFALGEESLRAVVEKDDFQAQWQDTEIVSNNSDYRTYYGKIHYIQTLLRDHPLMMRPGQQYRLTITFQPHLVLAGE